MKAFIAGFVFLAGLAISPSYPFKNDPSISNIVGEPSTDSTFYFPIEHFIDSLKFSNSIKINIDSFSVSWFSGQLHFMNEPVLYNYYLDREIYRLTWLRSFHPDVVIRFENSNGKISIIQKELTLIDPWKQVDSASYAYAPDKIKLKERKGNVKAEFWIDFEHLLEKNNFNEMPTTVAWEMGTDGSEWILEKHSKDGYYVVNRWSPNEHRYSKFREIGDYLIDLSIFKKERRY